MRTYLIDDLTDKDYQTVLKAFDDLGLRGSLEGIYYLPLPEDLLQGEQKAHLGDCGPFFMALEGVESPDQNSLRLELLVRARNKIRCSCVSYATTAQREHMIEYLDQFVEELEVSV
ncbi:hypothetical protein LF599_09565 [Pseudodesulfovibrio thermohalotolerans]|uniref:hypothetical protein n=1 Tax=Pseudodesulfovibrio thermohalotolerans TaxID=2880651 RepID=UPI0022B9E121|nr:hypothetical protein [Pseudodesulfovibrio thermohalotolerans]WFS60929.1 hypothetical protein LF599_09565 [Pseudodesulfovibrio thermohalotolerans]